MGCKSPRVGHCEARKRDKSDTRASILGFAITGAEGTAYFGRIWNLQKPGCGTAAGLFCAPGSMRMAEEGTGGRSCRRYRLMLCFTKHNKPLDWNILEDPEYGNFWK